MSKLSDKIDETKNKVIFFDDDHSYWFGPKRLKSVGSVMSRYTADFQTTYWKAHKVMVELIGFEYSDHFTNLRKDYGYMPDPELLFGPFWDEIDIEKYMEIFNTYDELWHRKRTESAFWGTKLHNEQEQRAIDRGFLKNPWSGDKVPVIHEYRNDLVYDNESICLDLSELEDGAYLELLIFDLDLNIAGQADMVFVQTVNGIRYVDVDDHKTNEKKPGKSDMFFCEEPFQDHRSSKHFQYCLQINMYAYLLSRHGFTPRQMAYTWYRNYDVDSGTLIEVMKLQKELQRIFE